MRGWGMDDMGEAVAIGAVLLLSMIEPLGGLLALTLYW